MTPDRQEIIQRKLKLLRQFLTDMDHYAALDVPGRRKEHYAVERLLQLLCESSADIGLQLLRMEGHSLASSYREVFAVLRDRLDLPEELASSLMDACAMRNLLTHLYDTIDIDRVITTIEPALEVYGRFEQWVSGRIT
ncbi:type VII toxin-antitoxin system HepT family RNase toxin [Ectothiorhodospira marina]|uniref:Uncharacterized conserved protein YutE, UPF0331/DUF86 family n=1 Tax=Ectothiorhodospira marina TaxID=1396821 RepID=A0A1H7MQG5_9GAMM|nr:HepT-like ribonuclease domain-containing protein [Ectothiorhodospira marina]SEL13319.1 Uncharacterized conserved protein YutE, UPF0331/DUF86 family [Ectothiorhodospira marina]